MPLADLTTAIRAKVVAAAAALNSALVNLQSVSDDSTAIDALPPSGGYSPLPAIFTNPKPNQVFQKNASGVADIRIEWRGTAQLARLKQGGVTVASHEKGDFTDIAAGWYDAVLVTDGVEGDTIKVGVGDVFLVCGQSNGISPLQPATYMPPRPSAPGKVIVSDYYGQGRNSFVDTYDCPISPTPGFAGCCWMTCGIALNRSYPVMFVIMSKGSSSTTDWVSGLGSRIFEGLVKYAPKAFLWHQGESDSVLQIPQGTSYSNMNALVQSLRAVTMTPWLIALNSINGGYAPIRGAQDLLVTNWPGICKYGPDTDTIRDPIVNPDPEFHGVQLEQHGQLWAANIIANGL